MPTTSKTLVLAGIVATTLLTALAFIFVHRVAANPTQFAAAAKTQTATSTLSYMTPGTATTTLIHDAAEIDGTNQTAANSVSWTPAKLSLMTQLTASSTVTRLCRRVMYSMDRVDWFPAMMDTNANATTTNESLSSAETCFNFASSTESALGTLTVNRRYDEIPTSALRFTRVDYYLPIGSFNGAVWGQLQPIKEAR